jgi:hypothetical protein
MRRLWIVRVISRDKYVLENVYEWNFSETRIHKIRLGVSSRTVCSEVSIHSSRTLIDVHTKDIMLTDDYSVQTTVT